MENQVHRDFPPCAGREENVHTNMCAHATFQELFREKISFWFRGLSYGPRVDIYIQGHRHMIFLQCPWCLWLRTKEKEPLGTWVNHRLVIFYSLLRFSFCSPKAKSPARSKDTEFTCKSMRPLKGVVRDTSLSQIFILGSGDTQLWLVPTESWRNKP